MALSSLPTTAHVSITLVFALATLSFAFVSTTISPISVRSQQQLTFQDSLCRSSWSRIAQFDVGSSSFGLIDTNNSSAIIKNVTYSLISPRGWLEYCEADQAQCQQKEPAREQSGGAYTVLRCDFALNKETWRIWGKDFHLDRLLESYRLLVRQEGSGLGKDQEIGKVEPTEKHEYLAINSSLNVMEFLLDEAKTVILNDREKEKFSVEKGGESIIIVMLTLLWDPDRNNIQGDNSSIRVRGHAFSTMKDFHYSVNDDSNTDVNIDAVASNPNTPLQVVIGHLSPTTIERITNSRSDPIVLPNRYQNLPRAKLSSWCRRRRLLEDVFKTKDIGDVILTKYCDDRSTHNNQQQSFSTRSMSAASIPSVELLEGLTSNLFVVHPGNVLRTAPSSDVLGGYVRQRIINCAEQCGYKVEIGPILLDDASLWKEVFLTSSIRLIMPVKLIYLPNDSVGKNDEVFELETLWEDKELKHDCHSPQAASNILYAELTKNSKSH